MVSGAVITACGFAGRASCGKFSELRALAMELAGPVRFSVLHPLLFCLTSPLSTPSNLSCSMILSVIGIICSYRGGLLVTSTSSQYSKDRKGSLLIRSSETPRRLSLAGSSLLMSSSRQKRVVVDSDVSLAFCHREFIR